MTAFSAVMGQRARVALARVHQSVGWAGLAGTALFAVAAGVMSLSWSAQRASLDMQVAKRAAAAPAPIAALAPAVSASAVAMDLPRAGDIPLLLTQMKQAAVSNGLEWRAADYRVTPATPTQPASLEVRCTLKGPYPKLRSMLVQLMGSVPAFAIREFVVNRPNADLPDVEAKLVLAVFLQDGAVASAGIGKGSP